MFTNTPGTHKIEYFHDYVVFDLETTGVNCHRDKVVEISAIKVADSQVTEEFSSLVNPECPIPFYASQVNGITDCIHDALMDSIGIEDWDRFQRIVEYDNSNFDIYRIY